MNISIIVPVLNESAVIDAFATNLMKDASGFEIIFVDGGSSDDTRGRLESLARRDARMRILGDSSTRGRARQMNHGALAASGDVLLFLHADTVLPTGWHAMIDRAMREAGCVGGGFMKKYDKETAVLWVYRLVVGLVRTRLFRNLVGTNAMFIRRSVFMEIGMYPPMPILEDVGLCDAMKKSGRLAIVTQPVVCSSRRYHEYGVWRHILVAARVLFLYRSRRVGLDHLTRVYANSHSS